MTKVTTTETQLSTLKSRFKLNGLTFVIAMWLLSRLLIVFVIQIIAPLFYSSSENLYQLTDSNPIGYDHSFVPKPGWEMFSHWDGKWYEKIATVGYDYANDGNPHSIAFFPLFPLLIRTVMTVGLPFNVAGTLVSNLAFLGTLILVYDWTQSRHGISAAKWTTAVLAWCPLSLYGTVIYTEGLFLFLTTAALQAFDNHQHIRAALFGALATATRATGITLIPAFLLVAWKERRPPIAYGAGLFAGVGILLFSVYCATRFHDPLAFAHAQKGWEQPNWFTLFGKALTLHKASLIKVVTVFGGGYLLWYLRAKLRKVVVAYGFSAWAMFIASPVLMSAHRYVYGIVSFSQALGVLLSSHRRWGYVIIGCFSVVLFYFSLRFARWMWIG